MATHQTCHPPVNYYVGLNSGIGEAAAPPPKKKSEHNSMCDGQMSTSRLKTSHISCDRSMYHDVSQNTIRVTSTLVLIVFETRRHVYTQTRIDT